MNLGDLITALEAADPAQTVVHGFANPHSYRGDYMDLAFESVEDTTVRAMLDAARSAVNATFQGYDTWCWLSEYGDVSGESISPQMLAWMLHESAPVLPSVGRAALRDRVAAALREHGMVHLGDQVPADEYDCCADAVLPAAADRAAVLVEAANAVDSGKTAFPEPIRSGASWAARMLRRMAAEARDNDKQDDTDLTEADVDRMMAAGTPVQIVTAPPATHGAPVLPVTGRATTLQEEAARIRAHCPDHLDSGSALGAWMACHCAVADDMLRRMAAEARQDPTPDSEEAHPPHDGWLVEMRASDGEWAVTFPSEEEPKARERFARGRSQSPDREWRLIRMTASYAVAEVAEARQDGGKS